MVVNKKIFVSEMCIKIGTHTGMCWEMKFSLKDWKKKKSYMKKKSNKILRLGKSTKVTYSKLQVMQLSIQILMEQMDLSEASQGLK